MVKALSIKLVVTLTFRSVGLITLRVPGTTVICGPNRTCVMFWLKCVFNPTISTLVVVVGGA